MPINASSVQSSAMPLLHEDIINNDSKKPSVVSNITSVTKDNARLLSENSTTAIFYGEFDENPQKLNEAMQQGGNIRHDAESRQQQLSMQLDPSQGCKDNWKSKLICLIATVVPSGVLANYLFKSSFTGTDNHNTTQPNFSTGRDNFNATEPNSAATFVQPHSSDRDPNDSFDSSKLAYSHYRPSNDVNIADSNPTQSSLSTYSVQSHARNMEASGGLDDSFGNHGLHHDGERDGVRHGRRHLSDSSQLPSDSSSNSKEPTALIKRLNHILRKSGKLRQGRVSKDEQLPALASYVVNPLNSSFYPNQLKKIARTILSDKHIYGGNKNEPLSDERAEYVVVQWFVQEILSMPIEEYIANKMRTEPKTEPYTIGDLKYLLSQPLPDKNLIDLSQLTEDQRSAFDLLWQTSVEKLMPVLTVNSNQPNFSGIELDSIKFANYYTGVKFLESLSIKHFTEEEAIKVGQAKWQVACEEGISKEQMHFFITPALFAVASIASKSDSGEAPNRLSAIVKYLEYRTELDGKQQDIENKFDRYREAFKLWQNKSILADDIIEACGADLKSYFSLSDTINASFYPYLNQGPDSKRLMAKSHAKEAYLNGDDKPCNNAPNSLEAIYSALTLEVADSFSEIDEDLIKAAFRNLPADELAFINSPQASVYLPKARPLQKTLLDNNYSYSDRDNKLQAALEGTDLFLVERDTERRLYAIRFNDSNNSDYSIHRLDKTARQVSVLVGTTSEVKITTYQAPKEWGVEDFTLEGFTKLSGSAKATELLLPKLKNEHNKKLFMRLYEAGNTKSDRQQIWNLVKHLIPFYSCVEGSINEDPEAVQSCLIDTASFLPILGKPLSLSSRFASSITRGVIQGGAGKGIVPSLRGGIQSAVLPSSKDMLGVSKTALEAFDPGFIPISSLSKVAAKKITQKLAKQPNTEKIASEINSVQSIESQVKGIQNWNGFSYKSGLADRLVEHQSGFYTTFDDTGEITGKLYLVRGDRAIPVTELAKDKYYMIEEGNNHVIITKSKETDEFEFVESVPKENTEINKYLDNTWCSPLSRSKRQVNEYSTSSCMEILSFDDEVHHTASVPLFGQNIQYAIEYKGLLGMETKAREAVFKRTNELLFFDLNPVQLSQKIIEADQYERFFSDRDVIITEQDLRFSDASDRDQAYNSQKLTKNEKLALRLVTGEDDPIKSEQYSDGMDALVNYNLVSSFEELNNKLINKTPLSEHEKNWDRLLSSGLAKLPNNQGEMVSIFQGADMITPYDASIKVDDLVSNLNTYLILRRSLNNKIIDNHINNAKTYIIYKIQADSAKPLLEGTAALGGMEESIIPKNTVFQVKGITIAEDKNYATRLGAGEYVNDLPKRILVTLEEVELPLDGKVKNIRTGEEENIFDNYH